MPRFWFTTDRSEGRREVVAADSLPQALLDFKHEGVAIQSGGPAPPALAEAPGIDQQLLISVYEQIAALLEQGLELTTALRTMAGEVSNRRLARSLTALADHVTAGYLLSEAMAEQPSTFAPLVINTVAAGEASGQLAESIRSLSEHQRELQQLGHGLALPLVYPVFLIILVTSITMLVSTYIWPQFRTLYKDLGLREEAFPWITGATSHLLAFGRIVIIPVLVVLAVLVIFYSVKSIARSSRLEIRPFGLPVPLFGRLAMYGALARCAASLRLLLANGVPAGRSLRLAGEASGNRHISLAMRRAEAAVNEGGRLAQGLRETGLLPEAFVTTLAGAEASGDFTAILEHIQEDYTRRVNYLGRKWVIIAGPVVVVILGLIVGVLAVSMFAPLISIIDQLSQ